jgi:hypothetical protein
MASLAWGLNLATFLGIAILAVPVWSLNTRKRKLHQVRQADSDAKSDSDFRTKTRGILADKHKKNVEDWRRIDQICLIVGYALLLGAALLRVILPAL